MRIACNCSRSVVLPTGWVVPKPISSKPLSLRCRADPGGEDISDAMKADLERFKRRQGAPVSGAKDQLAQDAGSTSPFAGIKDSLDKLLIADFFLVLVALAWLGVAVAISSITGDKETPLLTIWYALWPTLWQSALGLLMAGALVSGGLGKLAEQQGKGQQ